MISGQPLVSICAITYNHGRYIRQCLEGMLMQRTDFPFEIVIGDDCSTDNTAEIIKEFAAKHSNIIPVLQQKNVGGLRNAYEFCYPKLRGKYIAFCEGDDFWTHPEKLQRQVAYLEKNPDCVLTFHGIDVLSEPDGKIHNLQKIEETVVYSRKQIFHTHIPTLSAVIRNCIRSFPQEFFRTPYADIFLFGMLARHGGAACLPFTGGIYRKHHGGMYTRNSSLRQFSQTIQTRKLMLSCAYFNPEEKAELKKEIVRKKRIYVKNFLKKKEFSNCFRILMA